MMIRWAAHDHVPALTCHESRALFMNCDSAITRHGSSVAETVWNVSCVVINLEKNRKFVPSSDLITGDPVVGEDPPHGIRLHRGLGSKISGDLRMRPHSNQACRYLSVPSSRHWQPCQSPQLAPNKPSINKPLEVFTVQRNSRLGQNMNCARTIFTQLKRLYLRVVEHLNWTCLRFRMR